MDGSMLLPEYDHEFGEARKALERLPEDNFDWKPHEKSFTLHALAAHLADMANWVTVTFGMDVFDLDGDYDPGVPKTREGVLASFDENVAAGRKVLEGVSGDDLMKTWEMRRGGEVLLSMPKGAVYRSFIMNHMVHHRAQLGVYLRLLDLPVPGHYGPSADETD